MTQSITTNTRPLAASEQIAAQTAAIEAELARAFALRSNPRRLLSRPLHSVRENANSVFDAVVAIAAEAKSRRDAADQQIAENAGVGGSRWKRLVALVRSFADDAKTQALATDVRSYDTVVANLEDEIVRLDMLRAGLDQLSQDVQNEDLPAILGNNALHRLRHWTDEATSLPRTSDENFNNALNRFEATRAVCAEGSRDLLDLALTLSNQDAIRERLSFYLGEQQPARRAQELVEHIESDDRFAGLLGGPKARAECLLALDQRSFVELLVMAGQCLDDEADRHPRFADVSRVRRKERYQHVAPKLQDRLKLQGKTLDVMQQILCTSRPDQDLPKTLARVATVMNEAGSAIHLMWDVNGRSLRALFYFITHGFEQPDRQGPELRKSIGPHKGSYLGTDYGKIAGHVRDVAIIEFLRPHAADFRDPAVPRQLPSVAEFESDPRLARFSEPIAEQLCWIVRQDDTVASGLGFAAMWTFAKRHGYTERATGSDSNGVPCIDLIELATIARSDGRLSELIRAEERARVHLVTTLLSELESPKVKVFGKTSPLVIEKDSTGRGAVIQVDLSGELYFDFDDPTLQQSYRGKTPITIAEAIDRRFASATIRQKRPEFGAEPVMNIGSVAKAVVPSLTHTAIATATPAFLGEDRATPTTPTTPVAPVESRASNFDR